MIHALTLSPIILARLTDVVRLQAELLRFAASCATKEEVTQKRCACFLDEQTTENYFYGRGEAIATWYWKPGKRASYLTDFVTCHPEEREQKQQWVERIAREIRDLLDKDKKQIPLEDFWDGTKSSEKEKTKKTRSSTTGQEQKEEKKGCSWHEVAYQFFLYFYETYLNGDNPFPSELFTCTDSDKSFQPFGRQAYLAEFLTNNEDLLMCPFCDSGRHFISVSDSDSNHVYSAIDHFLPKSLYPHFACHPYNLVPTCHDCNSTFKGSKNPLSPDSKGRRQLSRSLLPYSQNAHEKIYLRVTLANEDCMPAPQTIASIDLGVREKDLQEETRLEVERLIDVLRDVYRIPERWKTMLIEETLYRRMRQFLDKGNEIPDSDNSEDEIYNRLEQLLYYLYHDDMKRDPLAFALTWTLVALLQENDKSSRDALMEEVESWFDDKFVVEMHDRARIAKQLLEVPLLSKQHENA